MKKSEIKVEFTIYDDLNLNHQEIANIIGFKPTFLWKEGDRIRKDLFRKESSLVYSTGYIKSFDVEIILNIIIQKLEPNIFSLSEYLLKNNLKSKFDIVLRISGDQIPSHFLSNKFINLCSQLNADIETDIFQ